MNETSISPYYDPRSSSSLKWSNWYLSLLRLAVGLLFALLIALIWLLNRQEVDEQRATLIADVLWIEQSLRFHLDGNAEQLDQLALDLFLAHKRAETFDLRARHILKNNTEIMQLLWLDTAGRTVQGMPMRAMQQSNEEPAGTNPVSRTLDLARLGKPVYREMYLADGETRLEVYVPIFDNQRFQGALVAVYSVPALLQQQVPW
ncbi:MAG TPA: PAS domain-containing sensor histidine kinase, partial [Accumulibacter sp.]|nr:PAS domain-containing sensor histidine kinase [Accumulibacter sp.]